jgi:hypothetical protein
MGCAVSTQVLLGILLGALLFGVALVVFLRDAHREREQGRIDFPDEATEEDRGSF